MQGTTSNTAQTMPVERTSAARLVVAGVGGGGTNAVNRMVEARVRGIEFVAINTDAQALEHSRAGTKLRIGDRVTRGLGAGGNPDIGMQAAEESYQEIREIFEGADMVFITAGMGGGTGTGAGPLVAQAAREQGAVTIGVVTTPFGFERRRKAIAEAGVSALRETVDALIVVSNERLMQLAGQDTGAFEAYRQADDVLRLGIQGISDLITIPGLINLDFADLHAILADAGTAYLSIGEASGENRAETLARNALSNPLLELDIKGARGLIFNITGSDDLTMHEVGRIADILSSAAHPAANVIFGTVYDPSCEGRLKLTIVATGFEPQAATPQAQHVGIAPRARGPRPAASQAATHSETEAARPSYVAWGNPTGEHPSCPRPARVDATGRASAVLIHDEDFEDALEQAQTFPPSASMAQGPYGEAGAYPDHPDYAGDAAREDVPDDEYSVPMAPLQHPSERRSAPSYRGDEYVEDTARIEGYSERQHDQSLQRRRRFFPRRQP